MRRGDGARVVRQHAPKALGRAGEVASLLQSPAPIRPVASLFF